ncbi:MAG: polyhydroxybutyrate depolymerase [Sulfitobacter sp.]
MYRKFLAILLYCFSSSAAFACGEISPCPIGDRHYRVFVPESPIRPSGALVFAHGFGGTDSEIVNNKNLRQLARERGLVLIATKSVGPAWAIPFSPRNYESDGRAEESYYEAVIDDAWRRYGFERENAVMAGFSSGGMMTWHMACNRPDLFAGFISISGTFWLEPPASCETPVKSLVHIHGTEDSVVPLTGRQIRNTHQGDVNAALALYIQMGNFRSGSQIDYEDLSCEERISNSEKRLTFCTFLGGHRFSTSHLNFALEQL